MKKVVALCVVLCSFIGLMDAFAQKSSNPLDYPYYIYGEQLVTGRNSSVLSNVQYQGFSTNIPSGGENNGERNDKEKFEYLFNPVKTNPYIDIYGKEMQYWRKLESGEWITDAEAGNGVASHRTSKIACFLFVLDGSGSLGSDFAYVKSATLNFIDELYKVSSAGNIHIGIISFSTMDATKLFPIVSLTESTRMQLRDFVAQQFNQRDATSMYYAIDMGIKNLTSHVNSLNPRQFGGAHIITFTDGLDNTSQLENEGLYSLSKVSKYVTEKLRSTTFNNVVPDLQYIDSWVVGAQGVDVQASQISMMKSQLQALASNSQFVFLENVSELESTFARIASSLTKKWLSLVCTSALNHDGPVCWTLGEIPIKKEEPKPIQVVKKKEKHMLLGVHAGIGLTMYKAKYSNSGSNGSNDDYYDGYYGGYYGGYYNGYYDGYYGGYEEWEEKGEQNGSETSVDLKAGVGIDVAYPITYKFGLGGYFSIGYPYLALGVLTTVGDYHDKKAAFVGGLGMDVGFLSGGMNFDIRGGVLFRNGLYMMLDFATGMDPFAMAFNIGYNFGNLFTVK